jgi:hypothetical protein
LFRPILRFLQSYERAPFEIGMRSRSDPQNNVIFGIAPIHDPIRQKPGECLLAMLPVCVLVFPELARFLCSYLYFNESALGFSCLP